MRVKALYDQVLFREELNPFIKLKSKGGLFLATGASKSEETGEIEVMDKIIGFGMAVEVGPDCKYVKEGDFIFYDRRSVRAVPVQDPLWNMPERGLVGVIEASDEDLQAAYVEYHSTLAEMADGAKQRSIDEEFKRLERAKKEYEQADKDGKLNILSPLIKIH